MAATAGIGRTTPSPRSGATPLGAPRRRLHDAWRKGRWPVLAAALLATGLVLRLAAAGDLSVHADRWLPWLNPPTVTVYFPDAQGRFLVPVARRVDDNPATPEEAVRQLLDGPRDRTALIGAFPRDTALSRLRVLEGEALVEVTLPQRGAAGSSPSPMALSALAQTLRGFGDVTSVRLEIDGVVAGSVPVPSMDKPRPIYYRYGVYLVPAGTGASSPEAAVLQYLAQDGPHPGLEGLPADVRLLEYRFDAARGLARVGFTYTDSVRQLALADPDGIRRSLIGIIATLTGFPEVKAVMLDFEGHARLGLGQCADLLRAPQLRPRTLNDEEQLHRS